MLWGVLIVRAGFLQMLPDSRLDNLKRRQFETSLQIRTRRGAIVDRQGNELAASVPAYSLSDVTGDLLRLNAAIPLSKDRYEFILHLLTERLALLKAMFL